MQNEQLEIIRAKFESLHPVPNWVQWCGDDYDYTHYRYEDAAQEYSNMWRVWISCMSQELEITGFQDPTFNIARREIIKDLEAQGYRVKRG